MSFRFSIAVASFFVCFVAMWIDLHESHSSLSLRVGRRVGVTGGTPLVQFGRGGLGVRAADWASGGASTVEA